MIDSCIELLSVILQAEILAIQLETLTSLVTILTTTDSHSKTLKDLEYGATWGNIIVTTLQRVAK